MISRRELIKLIAPIYSVLNAPPQLFSIIFTMAWVRLVVTLKVKPVTPNFMIALTCCQFRRGLRSRRGGLFPHRKPSAQTALTVCEMTVATAAPRMPMSKR